MMLTWAFGWSRQVAAPDAAAVLACSHFSLASSLGGVSSSLTHCRVAETRCAPATASPTAAMAAPIPIREPPMISGPACTAGQFRLCDESSSALLMTPASGELVKYGIEPCPGAILTGRLPLSPFQPNPTPVLLPGTVRGVWLTRR